VGSLEIAAAVLCLQLARPISEGSRPDTKRERMGNRNFERRLNFFAKATKAKLPRFQAFKGTPKGARW
jgi:hypothetical protein